MNDLHHLVSPHTSHGFTEYEEVAEHLQSRGDQRLAPECPRYCVDPHLSAQRGTFCECGYVRDIMCSIRTVQAAA